ncbi:EAL domain-containing protein [Methylicorpusculum oleiharenae]|uniref:EAL domain-containing protein n=1 Tax=Methylicorpusculum oleiharenae TaxID=1338687 RepID=UPI001357EDD4|nr:EAL domain-containing protein [Methylicorpusculum oleiharenae]MCD2450970.1 EAL domain-containing protein [Methylicorpusculum oleiharenae]
MKTLMLVLTLAGFGLSEAALCSNLQAPLKFAVLAFRPKAQAMTHWEPLAVYLSVALDQRVELGVYDYSELDAAVSRKEVDIVLTNPGHSIQLQLQNNLSAPLVTQVTQAGDYKLSAFGGVIFTRHDALSINALADLSEKRIAITFINSAGGYQMQVFELLSAGVPLPKKQNLITTGMPHDLVVEAVMTGRADAGFVRSGVLEGLHNEGKLDLNQIKIINQQKLPAYPYISSTPLYPEWPVSVMPQVDEQLSRRLIIALLNLPPDSSAARSAGIYGFIPPANYESVHEVLRKLRLPPYSEAPDFTLSDLWKKYQLWITSIGILTLLLTASGFLLIIQNRRLRQSEQRFATLFELAPEPTWIIADGRFIDCNMAAVRILGYKNRTKLLNARPADISPERQPDGESSQSKAERILQLVANGEPQRFEWIHKKFDGSKLIANVSLDPAILNGKKVVLCSWHDVTQRKQTEARLLESERKFRELSRRQEEIIWATNIGTWEWNIRSGETIFNERWAEITGHTLDELTPYNIKTWIALVHPEDIKLSRDKLEKCFSRETASYSCEVRMRHKQGHWIWILDQGRIVEWTADNMPLRMSGTHQDITGRKQVENELKLAASVFTHAKEGILITDADATIIEVNNTFSLVTGYSRAEILGQNPRILNSGRQPPEFYSDMWQQLIDKGHWCGEVWNRRKSGEVYAELLTISAVKDTLGSTKSYVALFTDITQIKEQQHQLEHIAHFDTLTQLPNRLLLADRLRQAMINSERSGRSLALIYLDLDGFKAVNDHYGHPAGDELLIKVAQRMKSVLREGDTLGRIGGDEFVAILIDLEQNEDWEPVLNRLLIAAAQPVTINEDQLAVSASIGVTLYPLDNADADQLLRHADQAMYQAKQQGKNSYQLFDIAGNAVAATQRETLESIRRAIDYGEFVLYYQPKVNMKTGEIIGAEALIRWQHPERGLLPPAAFLPFIDKHPISLEIGEWVIDTALSQLAAWRAEGLEISVSVNISALQLQQTRFEKRLFELLTAHPEVEPCQLELEIIESSALEDIAYVSGVMNACVSLGVQFALDDFGTGYSSLTYLKRLPASTLKIDQSFVRDMLEDQDDLAIVEGVMGLANAFGREVIAEGVETIAHGNLLLALGCELAQGYGIAKPMSAPELKPWIKTWRPDPSWAAWNHCRISRNQQPLLFAEVEHRAWVKVIAGCLKGEREVPPPLDEHLCRFGIWYKHEGRIRYGNHPEFQDIEPLHRQVHDLSKRFLKAANENRHLEVLDQLDELYTASNQLINALHKLIAVIETQA